MYSLKIAGQAEIFSEKIFLCGDRIKNSTPFRVGHLIAIIFSIRIGTLRVPFCKPTILRSYHPTVLQSYSPTVLQSYSPTVLQSYSPTVLQSYSLTVLQSYSLTVLLHRNALRQVPRLIHIAAAHDGDMIG